MWPKNPPKQTSQDKNLTTLSLRSFLSNCKFILKQLMQRMKSKVEIEEMESDMDVAGSMTENSSQNESDENGVAGNTAWADAMSKVLRTNISKDRNFILSKAKKDFEVKSKEENKVEIVDETGKTVESSQLKKTKSYSQRRQEMLEKQRQKSLWEAMGRVKPNIRNKDKEREFVRIATRGVVQLFNAVEKHQKASRDPKLKNSKRNDKVNVKGNFMDILKGYAKQDKSEEDPVMKKVANEETWSILKDDFMIGTELKDWDKETHEDD